MFKTFPLDAPIDAVLENHGSLMLLRPWTEAARTWINQNVEGEVQWLGEALAVGPRYAPALIQGMQDDGLYIE